jgi:hypothetical protein
MGGKWLGAVLLMAAFALGGMARGEDLILSVGDASSSSDIKIFDGTLSAATATYDKITITDNQTDYSS